MKQAKISFKTGEFLVHDQSVHLDDEEKSVLLCFANNAGILTQTQLKEEAKWLRFSVNYVEKVIDNINSRCNASSAWMSYASSFCFGTSLIRPREKGGHRLLLSDLALYADPS
jgi:hypothetical protein